MAGFDTLAPALQTRYGQATTTTAAAPRTARQCPESVPGELDSRTQSAAENARARPGDGGARCGRREDALRSPWLYDNLLPDCETAPNWTNRTGDKKSFHSLGRTVTMRRTFAALNQFASALREPRAPEPATVPQARPHPQVFSFRLQTCPATSAFCRRAGSVSPRTSRRGPPSSFHHASRWSSCAKAPSPSLPGCSYQGYYTRSHQNSEVKCLWAGIPGVAFTFKHHGLAFFFFFFFFL